MTLSKEQFSELRSKGLSVDQIVKFQEGWEPPTDDKTLVEQAKGVVSDFSSGIRKALGTVTKETSEKGVLGLLSGVPSGVLQSLGAGGKAVSQVVGAGLETLDDLTGEVVSRTGKNVIGKILSTDIGKKALGKIGETQEAWEAFSANNPLLADNISAGLNLVEGALTVSGIPATGRVVSAASRFSKNLLKEGTEKIAKTKFIGKVKGAKDIVKKEIGEAELSKTIPAQITGLNPDTVKAILSTPDEFTAASAQALSRSDVAESVFNKISKRIKDLDTTGKEYDVIRKSGDKVTLNKGWLDSLIKEKGFDIKKGKILGTTKSASRNTTDIGELQKLKNNWGNKTEIDANEFLNLREDLAELARFGDISGKTKDIQVIASGIRAEVNKQGRKQVSGLKKLDNKFAPEKKELDAIRKEFFDRNTGDFKDTAINKIINATGKGKDKLLNRLEKIEPGISDRINLAKALEDIEIVKGNKVGTYTRSIVGGGLTLAAASTLGIVPGFAAFVLTSPTMMVKYLKWIGKVSPGSNNVIDAILSKIKSGTKMDPSQKKFIKEALIPDTDIKEEFIKSIGGISAAIENQ